MTLENTENIDVTVVDPEQPAVDTSTDPIQNSQTNALDNEDHNKPLYSKAQMSKIVSDRVNKLNTYKKTVESMSKLTGMSEQQIIDYIGQQQGNVNAASHLQGQPQPSHVQQQPQQNDYATQMAIAAGRVAIEAKRQIELSSLQSNPIYSDLFSDTELKENVMQVADAAGISVKDAYWQLHGEAKATSIQKDTEQRVLANVKARSGLGAESDLSTTEELQKLNLTAEEIAFAQKSGMDVKRYAALKGVHTLDDYERLFKQ